MPRKFGSFQYGKEAEDYLLDLAVRPKSTHAISKEAKFKFPKMHYMTAAKILERLARAGKLTRTDVGGVIIWAMPERSQIQPNH